MPLAETVLVTVAEKVFSYALDQGQNKLVDWARDKLGLQPKQQAFKHAVGNAYIKFEKKYPQWAADLFNASFLEHEGAPILAQFLIRDGYPDPSDLASRWAISLNIRNIARRTTLVRELEPAATDFLEYLARSIKAESELTDLNDSRSLEQLVGDLKAIRRRLDADQATPGTRRDYLHWMLERHLYLDSRSTLLTHRQVQLKLDDVYISLRGQHEDEPGMADLSPLERDQTELEANSVSSDLFLEEREQGQRELGVERFMSKEVGSVNVGHSEVLDLAEAINLHDCLVILGGPGSGKTTLLRYLALKHARALWNGKSDPGNVLGTAHFPVRIRIADFVEYGLPKGKSLTDFLGDYCIIHECPKAGLTDLLAIELKEGNCLILLDGLDEIVSASERLRIAQHIEEFVGRHLKSHNRFVITSRVAGYRSAPLGKGFAHYMLQEMDNKQIQNFLVRWCNAVEDAQTPEISVEARRTFARREVEGIMKVINASPGVRRLASNPLLLRILALIHSSGMRFPQRRAELYRIAADTLARTHRAAQGVPESALALVEDEYLTPLLGKLAFWLHIHKPSGGATEREVYEVLGKEWADLNDLPWDADRPNPKIKSDVGKFLITVREHTGIFVERAPNHYGFMHLTFEEYYAARYLIDRSKTRAGLIRQHLHDPRWEEPILLALGLVGQESTREASELLETAILAEGEDASVLGFTPSPYENLLGRDYLFALRCLGDHIPAHPKLIRRLIKRLANEILHRTGSARFQRYQLALEERLRLLKGSEVASELFPFLVDAFDDPDFKVRLRAVQSMERSGRFSKEALAALLKALHDPNFNVRYAATQSLRQLGWITTEVIAALINSLYDDKPGTRSWAAESLGQLGQASNEVVTALLNCLGDNDLGVRRAAAESLGQLGQASDRVIAALLRSLHSRDVSLRYHAAQSLGQLNSASDEVVTALLSAIHDPDPRVRRAAVWSLGFLEQGQATEEVVTALLSTLHDPVPWVRGCAAESLAPLGQVSKEVVDSLLDARSDGDHSVRRAALQSLRQLVHAFDEAASILLTSLRDPDSRMRRTSAESLGLLEPKQASNEVVKALLNTLDDPDHSVRRQAVESIGLVGKESPEVLTALIQALKYTIPAVREAAAKSFENSLLTPEVLAALTESLYDASPEVCYQAAISLGKLGRTSPNIEAMLLKALQSAESASIRHNAALLLGQLGHSSISTIHVLLYGLLDRYKFVRTACAQALALLGQRFPSTAETIATELLHAIEDPEFDRLDDNTERRSAHDYAFDGLWQLKDVKTTS